MAAAGLMSVKEFARYRGVRATTVYQWIWRGILNVGNGLRYTTTNRPVIDRRINDRTWIKRDVPVRTKSEHGTAHANS